MKAYQHILLATDFSSSSESAARRSMDLAGHFNAALTLLHVVEYLPPGREVDWTRPANSDPAQYLADQSLKRLEKLAKRMQYYEAIPIVRVTAGAVKFEIIRIAKEISADLIVMGSHGHDGLSSLLGSTAEGVVLQAPCEVLVVRDCSPKGGMHS